MQENRHPFDYTNIKNNPLFENFTQLPPDKKVRFIKQLYKDLEAEISHSRTDSIKILDQLLNDIPKIVQDLKSKGFWSLSIDDLEQTHPSVPILSNVSIPSISLNKNTLDIVMVSKRNLPESAFAAYVFAEHIIELPVNYATIFSPIRITTDATRISELTRLFKQEMMIHVLTHELQHARDTGLNPQKYSSQNLYEYTDNQCKQILNYFSDRMMLCALQDRDTFEHLLYSAQNTKTFLPFLKFDFKNLIHLYTKNQGRAKKHIIKELVPIAKDMLLSQPEFKGTIEHLYFEPTGNVISSQASMDSLEKFNEKIMDGLLEAIASFPNAPKNMPKLTNNFFIQNADILQIGNKQKQPFVNGIHKNVLDIFYHPEINLPQRIFLNLLANFELDSKKFCLIANVDVVDQNQQVQNYLCFDDDEMGGVFIFNEISTYRTQDVDVTVANAILGANNDISRFFYGDTLSKYIKTGFHPIRRQNQDKTLEVLLDVFKKHYIQCKIRALMDIFEEIFELDFNLVKGTIFDMTSMVGLKSYKSLTDGSMASSQVSKIKKDIFSTFLGKTQHSKSPTIDTLRTAFFGGFRDILCLEIFKSVCRDLIGVGLYINSAGRGYMDAFADSLYESAADDQNLCDSELFIHRLYPKVCSVRQDLIASLSFEQKFISIARTLFTSNVVYAYSGIVTSNIYQNARINYLNKEHLQASQTLAYPSHLVKIAKACINKTTAVIRKHSKAIEMHRKTLKTYYDFCVAEYLKMHPKTSDAQSYVDSCQSMIDAWNKLIVTTYNQDLIQVTDVTDKRIDNLTIALQPLIESFYDLCIGCVLTSPDFNQYVRTTSEDATLNFQKLISEREILPKDKFVSYFDKMIKLLMSLDLTFFGSRNISNSQIHKFDPLDDGDSITETLESLLYALKFANALSEHYRLSIILGLVAYKIAEFDLCYFFCTKPTIYK